MKEQPTKRVMRMMLTCIVIIGTAVVSKAQQRPQFTQYLFSGLVINPAYAGAEEALSATFIDRHQWSGIDGAPTTQTFSLHALNRKKKVGLGMLLVNDRIGIHQNITAQGIYAYHLKVARESFLSFGLQGGMFHIKSDYGSLVNPSAPDPKLSNYFINELFFDLGAGLYFRSPRFHLGISAPELLPKSAQINDTTLVRFKSVSLLTFLKYRFILSPTWATEVALLGKHYTNTPFSIDGTVTFVYKDILTTGVSYRLNTSISYLIKIKATSQLQVGYAYDYPIGSISRLNNGSHELMVQYLFRFERSGVKSPRI